MMKKCVSRVKFYYFPPIKLSQPLQIPNNVQFSIDKYRYNIITPSNCQSLISFYFPNTAPPTKTVTNAYTYSITAFTMFYVRRLV